MNVRGHPLMLCAALALSAISRGAEPEPLSIEAPLASPRTLVSGAELDGPSFSPDGRRVVYSARRGNAHDLFIVDRDGGRPRRLTRHPADDRDPVFSRDGRHVVWSSNRGGSYDLWMMPAAGGRPRRLTRSAGDERRPAWAPIAFGIFYSEPAEGEEPTPLPPPTLTYDKIYFDHCTARGCRVRWTSDDGLQKGALTEPDEGCRAPAISGDGLTLAYVCGPAERPQLVRAHADGNAESGCAVPMGGNVPRRARRAPRALARRPRQLRAAIQRGRVEVEPLDYWPDDPERAVAGARSAAFAPNGQWLLVEQAGDSNRELWALPRGVGDARRLVYGAARATRPSWSPDGERVAFVARAPGQAQLYTALSRFYLTEAINLGDYPELYEEGEVRALHEEKLAIFPGSNPSFAGLLHDDQRSLFFTADLVLQLFHKTVDNMLIEVERGHLAPRLRRLAHTLGRHYRERYRRGAAQDDLKLAVLFEVAGQLLAQEEGGAEPQRAVAPGEARAEEQPGEDLVAEHAALFVDAILDASQLYDQGFYPYDDLREEPIDFTQLKPRGHYDQEGLRGYFRAMMWLSQARLLDDRTALALYQTIRRRGLFGTWSEVMDAIQLFAEAPEQLHLGLLREVERDRPAWFGRRPRADQILDEVRRRAAERARIAGPDVAQLDRDPEASARVLDMRWYLFPQRWSADAETLEAICCPAGLCDPGCMPSALDVAAVLGSTRAAALRRNELETALGESFEQRLSAQARRMEQLGRAWPTNLYNGYLWLIQAALTPPPIPEAARPRFARSEAWGTKQLTTGLAAYAQLKHLNILYGGQVYGGLGAAGMQREACFKELPIPPPPPIYIEPNPELLRRMGRVLALVRGRISPLAPRTAQRSLAPLERLLVGGLQPALARQLQGRPLPAELRRRLLAVRDLLPDDDPGGAGEGFDDGEDTDQGVEEDGGVETNLDSEPIVADIFTMTDPNLVLEIGTGDIDEVYAVVPIGGRSYVVHGGSFSFYELWVPIAERLSDAEWQERLRSNEGPPARPPWARRHLVGQTP